MKVFLLFTKDNLKDQNFIHQKLIQAGQESIILSSSIDFKNLIQQNIHPDMVVLDFFIYNPITFNVYKLMEEVNYKVPVLTYNFPLPSGCGVRSFWIRTLETLSYNQIREDKYQDLFELLFSLFEQIRNKDKKEQKNLNISSIMSTGQLAIFNILVENLNQNIDTKTILEKLNKKDCKHWKENTLKCNISRLNVLFKKTQNCTLKIFRSGTAYRLQELPCLTSNLLK